MSAGLSAFSDYAGTRGCCTRSEGSNHGRGRAQGSTLFANLRQYPIGDRSAGDHGIRQGRRLDRRGERESECVYRERPRFSRARGLSHRARPEVSAPAQERALGAWLEKGLRCIGQIAIDCRVDATFVLTHRDDAGRTDLELHDNVEAAIKLARFDDVENYRPLKTAPTLRHGWTLTTMNLADLRLALDHFYPGRLAAFFAFEREELQTTPLRETL